MLKRIPDPIIFKGLKSITLGNTQQNSLLRLAQEGISVYSPHTAVDAAPGGLNDFLVDVVSGTLDEMYVPPLVVKLSCTVRADRDRPRTRNCSTITPIKDAPEGFEAAGYGRIVRFDSPQPLGAIVDRVTAGLGNLPGVSVAVPQHVPAGQKHEIMISSVGICAGSGGSMLNGLDVDLLFTGELSHHEALAAIEQGKCVITAFHSNTERAFLEGVMKTELLDELEAMAKNKDAAELGLEGGFEIAVSEVDRDPFEIITPDQIIW